MCVPLGVARGDCRPRRVINATTLRTAPVRPWLQVLHDIGEKHGVSPSVVAARWVLQQPGVSAIVLGARNATHLKVSEAMEDPVGIGSCM